MKTLKAIFDLVSKIDPTVILYGVLGIIFIILGGGLLNLNPPNHEIGYPLMTLGFAFFVYAASVNDSNKIHRKLDLITEKFNSIQNDLKKERKK